MAISSAATSHARRKPTVLRGYRRILVPIVQNAESERAVEVACRLAAERHASITAVAVIEVPPLLPLDSHMVEEERTAREILERAAATGDSFGVHVSPCLLRGREAGTTIVERAQANGAELLVIGATPKRRASGGRVVFGKTVEHVLKAASCRVMVIAAAPVEARAERDVPRAAA